MPYNYNFDNNIQRLTQSNAFSRSQIMPPIINLLFIVLKLSLNNFQLESVICSQIVPLPKYCNHYLLTYLLTPWSRVLLEKLTGSAASQEIPRILWNLKVHYRTQKCQPPLPILSQLHPVPTTSSHLL